MRGQSRARSERGASAVEYAVIVGAISLALLLVASALGINIQTGLCTAGAHSGEPELHLGRPGRRLGHFGISEREPIGKRRWRRQLHEPGRPDQHGVHGRLR